MSALPMRLFGDPILKAQAQPVTRFDDDLSRLAADMFETMDAAPGVGLAAPQVGVSARLIVFDSGEEARRGALCNGEIVWASDETQEGDEGCLSIPGLYFSVVRAMRVRVHGQTLDGNAIDLEGEGLLARIFQHEIDHTNGILFIDRLTPDLRKEAMRTIREQELGLAAAPQRRGSAL